MRLNWGNSIVLAFVLFCSFIIYIVIRGFQQNIDLVSDTYYLDELAFQEKIQKKSNLANSGLELTLEQSQDHVLIVFPDSFSQAEGTVHFYHPSRALFDKKYTLALNDVNTQTIDKEDLVKGHFKVKVNWQVGETAFFQETDLFIR